MSNKEKSRALGINFSTAANRLRKMILWQLVVETGRNVCYRCDRQIERIEDFSIEHREPWQSANDPRAAFFDLENIAFSHLRCNSGASASANKVKTHCPQGHPLSGSNIRMDKYGFRNCRACQNPKTQARMRRLRLAAVME